MLKSQRALAALGITADRSSLTSTGQEGWGHWMDLDIHWLFLDQI